MKYAIHQNRYKIHKKLLALTAAERDDDDSDESESDDDDSDETECDNDGYESDDEAENDQNNKGIFLKSAFEIENNLPGLFGKRMKERRWNYNCICITLNKNCENIFWNCVTLNKIVKIIETVLH